MAANNDKQLTIGVLGGMGTYATIHLFRQYARVFPAEKEWERPRILIDNRCTMPSRVRAFLYGEKVDELVAQMAESVRGLIALGGGCTKIIFACNTSHLFIDKVLEKVPKAKGKIVHIIETCAEKIAADGVKSVYLLASEGTIESGIYQKYLEKKNVNLVAPTRDEYEKLRACIEAVKQNTFTPEAKRDFLELIGQNKNVILGCTELPILQEMYAEDIKAKTYDPCLITLEKLKEEYDS